MSVVLPIDRGIEININGHRLPQDFSAGTYQHEWSKRQGVVEAISLSLLPEPDMHLSAHPALRSSVAHSKGDVSIARFDDFAGFIAQDVRVLGWRTPSETPFAAGDETPKRHL